MSALFAIGEMTGDYMQTYKATHRATGDVTCKRK